jgi:hypothetical protein
MTVAVTSEKKRNRQEAGAKEKGEREAQRKREK